MAGEIASQFENPFDCTQGDKTHCAIRNDPFDFAQGGIDQ